jgi:hypothetical protein
MATLRDRGILNHSLKPSWNDEYAQAVHVQLDVATVGDEDPRKVAELQPFPYRWRWLCNNLDPSRHHWLDRLSPAIEKQLVLVPEWRMATPSHRVALQLEDLVNRWTNK